ncbi:MAG: TonB-dependent receptor [Spirochaetales bacterium]|jgi:TonB-linked SusC/RagA family outer membrane protein|nr:TonB-dependent receptor [Spirochaetales bacterium]
MKRCNNSLKIISIVSLIFCVGLNIPAFAVSANGTAQSIAQQQDGRTIKGVLTDINGEPIPGATIMIKGSLQGTSTDYEGNYTIENVPDNAILVFSFVGMRTMEVNIEDRTVIDLVMEEDAIGLDEVVAIGYGSMKKKDLTGSVSVIETKDVASLPLASIGDMMQGKAAGVHVIANGTPGSDPSFLIRGTGTINDNRPLLVIDGVPTLSGLNQVNMDDVESLQVLKDASATAIYGSRGANGVIIITTKKGSAGKGSIDFNAYTGVQTATSMVEVLNASQFATLHNDMMMNAGRELNPAFLDPEMLGEGTDWIGTLLRPASMQNYSLSFTGGNEKTTYYISGTYLDQEGIIDNTGFKRYGMKFNGESKINKRVKVGNMITLNHDEKYSGSYSILNTLRALPTQELLNPDGTYSGPVERPEWDGDITNPIGQAKIIENSTLGYNLLGSVYADIQIMDGLVFRSTAGLKGNFWQTRTWSPAYNWRPSPQENSYLGEAANKSITWNWDNTLTYTKTFDDIHHLTLMAGTSAQENNFSYISGSIQDFASDRTQQLDNGLSQQDVGGTGNSWSLMSYMGRANYNYADKYLATATIRRDGSSRFGDNNKWGWFPSASLAWRISEEDFFQNLEFMNYMKLRAGYGVVGNQEIGNYSFSSSLSTISYVFNDNPVNGVVNYIMPNPNVQWESQNQANLGFDATMLNQRVSLIVDLYHKKTTDMLVPMDVPIGTGYSDIYRPSVNAGVMVNKGIEITATTHNFKGDFTWDTDFNISFNKNEVVALNDTVPLPRGSVGFNQNLARIQAGYPVDVFYGFVTDGIFQNQDEVDAHALQVDGADPYNRTSPGDIRYLDLNSDGIIDDDDRTFIGNPNPDIIFSLNNRFAYMGFDLNIFLQGVYGNDIYNANRIWNEGMAVAYNQSTETLNRWTGEGSSNDVPRAVFNDPNKNTRPSNRFLEDGSYFRIKNVILGYTFQGSMLLKTGIESARIYVSGTNLLTYTNYTGFDPEVGSSGIDMNNYPLTRTYSVGVNLSF